MKKKKHKNEKEKLLYSQPFCWTYWRRSRKTHLKLKVKREFQALVKMKF